jgi:hypothetical protein
MSVSTGPVGSSVAKRAPGVDGQAVGWDQCGRLAVMRRLLVAESALVPRCAHLLLVAEPLQVLGRDVSPRRFRRGR